MTWPQNARFHPDGKGLLPTFEAFFWAARFPGDSFPLQVLKRRRAL